MKVCTDSCVFGAWVAQSANPSPKTILDIGSGTGLLSLMLAQHFGQSEIHALEIEPSAILQSQQNFQNATFSKQLQLFPISIQDFSNSTDRKYDVVICNPPFFSAHLLSDKEKNNIAKHNNTLSPSALSLSASKLMNQESEFWLLIPTSASKEYISCFENNGLFLNECVEVFHNHTKPSFRLIIKFSKLNNNSLLNYKFIIQNQDGTYTNSFVELLKKYYLNL